GAAPAAAGGRGGAARRGRGRAPSRAGAPPGFPLEASGVSAAMHEAVNEILIRGTAEQVMELAFDLPRWPEFLPHYRWVKVLAASEERMTVEMACRRSGIPLRWRSYLWVGRAERRMRFQHIAGPAR